MRDVESGPILWPPYASAVCPYFTASLGRTYDVSPDGQKFIMIKESASSANAESSIVLVLNWTQELKRLLPVD